MEAQFPQDFQQSQQNAIIKQTKASQQIKKELLTAMEILSQKCPSNKQISECHQIITNNMRCPQFLSLLFELVQYYQTFNDTIAKLLVTQISNYIRKQISFGYDQRHDKLQINNNFMVFFFGKSSEKYKKMCESSYMNFLFGTTNEGAKAKAVQGVQNLIINIISSNQKTLNQYSQYLKITMKQQIFIPRTFSNLQKFEDIMKQLISLSHIIKSLLMGGSLQISHLKKIINVSFGVYMACLKVVVRDIILAVKSKNQQVLLIKTQLGQILMDFLSLMYNKADYLKCPSLKQTLLLTPEIYKFMQIIFKLSLNYQSLTELEGLQKQTHIQRPFQQFSFLQLISPQIQNKSIRNIINMKSKAIQILTNCGLLIKKKKKYEYNEYSYMMGYLKSLFASLSNVVCKQLCYYLQQYEKEQRALGYLGSTNISQNLIHEVNSIKQHSKVFTDPLTKQVYRHSIYLLSQLIKLPPLYTLAQSQRQFLIYNLCFPLLVSRAQHNEFSVSDFKYFRQDIINGTNVIHLENSISKLIESYYDYIDGSIKSVMEVTAMLTSYYLQHKDQKYLLIFPKSLTQSWFLRVYSQQRQVQALLTVFTIGSYLASSRTDIVCDLQKWINQHKEFVIKTNASTKITISFLLMYSYYADNFYMNLIKGVSSQQNKQLHRELIRYFCLLMKQSKNQQTNQFKSKQWELIFLQSLDCLNNTFNQITLFPALYYQFPQKKQLMIPNTMGSYPNYPYYPIKYQESLDRQGLQLQKNIQNRQGNKKQEEEEDDIIKTLLVHYRRLGINKEQYIFKDDMCIIIDFLLSNFASSFNLQIIEMLTQFFLEYVKHETKNQGGLINVPIVIREDFVQQVAIKIISMYRAPVPNSNLFWLKATQLLYILHVMTVDPYYLIQIGLQKIWLHPSFWTIQNDNLQGLLKCTDIVVRLAAKHYTSSKNIEVNQLLSLLASNISTNLSKYIKIQHKYGLLFGIILNLMLLKINPQEFMKSIFDVLNDDLFIQESKDKQLYNQDDRDSTQMLISRSFYLFLCNIHINGQGLIFQDGLRILTFIGQYLISYKNAAGIVVQTSQKLGKALVICLAVIQKQFQNLIKMSQQANPYIKNQLLEFIWKNILYSSKVYKTIVQKRLVSTYSLCILSKSIQIIPCPLSVQKIAQMYNLASKCVFQVSNRQTLIDQDLQQQQNEGSQGQQEWWQNSPISFKNNDMEYYMKNDVELLHDVTVLFLNINKETKQWMVQLIQNQPPVIKNFLKHKIVPYNSQASQAPLRKIVKVKRYNEQMTQQQQQNQNTFKNSKAEKNNKRQIKKQISQQEHQLQQQQAQK